MRIQLIVGSVAWIVGTAALGAEPGYYARPALHGETLIFASEGDLWSARVPENDDGAPIIAHRLTSGDGAESHPCISADGTRVAFSGQYDGNTDVYVMPIDGGPPRRLTFHPGADQPIAWSADGGQVLFRSSRAQPLGRPELYRVSALGGMPQPSGFGECTMISFSGTGRRFAFTRWSNETWHWKRYRGGTAPEIWIGDFDTGQFTPLTDDPGSDLFPMWMLGRVFFLSDRTGTANIFSDSSQGGELEQRTRFGPDPADPTAIEGYDVRWPSAEPLRRARRIVFCQGGGLAILDVMDNSVRRLDVRLASDRVARRQRFAPPLKSLREYALSPDGSRLLVGARGELQSIDVKRGTAIQLTRSSFAREWGATHLGDDRLALISDANGEQQIAVTPTDGSDLPSLVTDDREDWLLPPAASADGKWIAFADKTQRLHVISMMTLDRVQIDQSDAWEITDYRFSPDSRWLAYVKPMPNGFGRIYLHALNTGQSFPVSSGLHDDREPRWDPAGKYLYFLSNRHLDPVLGTFDMEHVYLDATRIYVVPLASTTPPPRPAVAAATGFDLESWARPGAEDEPDESDDAAADGVDPEVAAAGADDGPPPIRLDTDGLPGRAFPLPVEAGNYAHLEALWGAVSFLEQPTKGLLDDDFGRHDITRGEAALHIYKIADEERKTLAKEISGYVASRDRNVIAHPAAGGFTLLHLAGGKEQTVDLAPHRLRVDIPAEWRQIFDEAWRLQRDFYWAPTMRGVDWPAMRAKYEALLPRVGTRAELNDLIGEMIGELGTSHTYIWGGQPHDEVATVNVGLLGADIEAAPGGFRLARIFSDRLWDDDPEPPLGSPHLGVKAGDFLLAINGQRLTPVMNVYDLLQDQAGRTVRLTVADNATGVNSRAIDVKAIGSERALRYQAWAESNRRYVEEQSGGRLGYLHIPDMGGQGLSAFSALFYPQLDKRGLVIDVRDNGGGFVSQMIVARLARQVIAFGQPRHGVTERYPYRALIGHLAAVIDQHAGSDGDIFPAAFRRLGLGPLIGTRTWGGVVGIRADKPFVDMGMLTQPEFAWWEAVGGWTIENRGVSPDIEVQITPNDRIDGTDPQLDRAISWLLAELEKDPKEPPPVPAYPRE
jgi:tricorn protease